MAAIWRVNNHKGHPSKYSQHSRSHSSPAAVLGSSGTPTPPSPPVPPPPPAKFSDPDLDPESSSSSADLLPEEFSARNRQSLPSSSQSLVLLHHPSHPVAVPLARRLTLPIPQPLQLSNTNINSSGSPGNAQHSSYSPTTTTSYATLSLLDAVGTGSGRRRLKEFPGYIPLSRYFIPPSASTTPVASNTPTTPTVPSFDRIKSDAEVAAEEVQVPDTEGTPTPDSLGSRSSHGTLRTDDDTGVETVVRPPADGEIDGTTNMEQQPPVAIIGDPEPLMTQDLLNFYKNRLHELEKSTQAELLERISVLRGFLLEHHDATNRLEQQLHELQDENTSLSKELEEGVKHRVEVIALVKENEMLKEKLDQLSNPKNPHTDPQIFDPTPIPSPDPSVTGSSNSKDLDQYDRIQTHYEDLIQQLLNKYTEQQAARENERSLANQNIDHLNDRCRRLETAVSDSLNDIIQERSKRVGLEEKLKETEEELNVSVFEMQSQLEIFERHMNETRMSPVELETVHEEETSADELAADLLPEEFLEDLPDLPDTASARGSMSRRNTASPSRRKTPSPTKKRRTPSPVPMNKEQGIQTLESEPKDVRELRQELEHMISEREAEEELLKSKKAEFEDAYAKFASIVEQARAREEDYNQLQIECEELRIHIEELLEQHDLDQEELATRQTDLDQMFTQLEDSLKQQVLDKEELRKKDKEIEELRNQLEEADTVSIIKDDGELKNLRLQLDEAKRETGVEEEKAKKANDELETLRARVEKLSKQHSEQVGLIEKGNIEAQGLRIQLETLNKQRSSDLETISKANTEIESLRSQIEQSTLFSTESTNTELASLREKLAEADAAKANLEKEKSRKEGDIKLLREQMQNLLKGQSSKETELSRVREDLENLRKRYDEMVSDRKRDEEWRHENFMELEAVRQRLSDVMRIKDQEHSLHQRDVDTWRRKDEEYQKKLGEVSTRMAEMVLDVNGRNELMKELNETIMNLKLADEASSVAMEQATKKIADLEREVQEEKRRVAVEITKANERVAEIEQKKAEAEQQAESLKTMAQDLEERTRGYEMALEADEERANKVEELEEQYDNALTQSEELAIQLEEALVAVQAMANQRGELEDVIKDLQDQRVAILEENKAKILALEKEVVDTKAHANAQVTSAEIELKKLETRMKVDEAKAFATYAGATDRIAVLEKQVKTYESLKRHKAQDESDLQSLKSHVVKIERIALQFLPLEDSGMLNAIDELKRSHLETQQKHKKRRKKEMLMAERSGMDL